MKNSFKLDSLSRSDLRFLSEVLSNQSRLIDAPYLQSPKNRLYASFDLIEDSNVRLIIEVRKECLFDDELPF